jgi:2'-5' RNA ligase
VNKIGGNMKYIIVCLLSGAVEEYHQQLVEEIAEKFEVIALAKQKAPTHFTLKDMFDADDIGELDKVLDEFVRTHKPAVISLEGYNRFDDNVIFMDINFSENARQLFKEFIDKLKELSWMQWGAYDDENKVFHCSLAYFDIKDKYKDICRYLLSNYSYSFEAYFDNVTIYKQVGENWELYKSYAMTYNSI